jgi:hypothetical protein
MASMASRRRRRSWFADAARDADVLHRRHVDDVAARERDVARHARALGADRVLGHLDDDLLPLLDDLVDGGGALQAQPAVAAVSVAAAFAPAAIAIAPSTSSAAAIATPIPASIAAPIAVVAAGFGRA